MRLACVCACTLACACEPKIEPSPCDEPEGEPALEVAPNRLSPDPLRDGAELPVFDAPQGGVFTELDVTLRGIAPDDLLSIGVTVTQEEDGEVIANQLYQGAGLPLLCQDDGSQRIPDMPVGFSVDVILLDLEGTAARLEAVGQTADADVLVGADIVLRVIEF